MHVHGYTVPIQTLELVSVALRDDACSTAKVFTSSLPRACETLMSGGGVHAQRDSKSQLIATRPCKVVTASLLQPRTPTSLVASTSPGLGLSTVRVSTEDDVSRAAPTMHN